MSPDDIFAAHMWPWPDPMLKRDPMGRVIFVNAAFLQLYGGRIENWTGHPVQGWPVPNAQGMPYRFETRAGQGENEIIYDWVETTLSDGNAIALARDVTVFHQQAASVLVNTAPPAAEPVAPPPQASAQVQPEAQFQPPAAVQAPAAPEQTHFNSPPQTEPAPAQPQHNPPSEPAPEPAAPPVEIPAPQPDPVDPPQPAPEPATPPQAAFTAPPPAAPEPEPKREFERRTLPVEDGDAVLGSNWRDAVIAKAIGASDAPVEVTPASAPAPQNYDQPVTTTGEGLKILLAEDNAINALLTRTLLEAEGCSVETVEDGLEAVAAMESGRYDLIFMDMRMPNMDGLEATRKIRAMGTQASKLPIIALTANAFDDDRNACFDSGMNDFMTKPVSADELANMVQTWTKKRDEQQSSAA
ncbi:response regulator [Robiginitomaculum antarcticum]|uniref:response regulator n=1 Tax=Robiginitomaculum antarcticum TaxID=437507 RepID=UPI00035E9E23|nr:response regulator [Robiginitomaculum antarcticum]